MELKKQTTLIDPFEKLATIADVAISYIETKIDNVG